MYAEWVMKSPMLLFPLCGLCCFIAVFTGAVVHAWRKGAPYEQVARLPLDDEESDHE